MAKIRTSSHRFTIETGRHGNMKQDAILNRVCPHCSDINTLRYLVEPPIQESELILKDELHVLQTCPKYKDLKQHVSEPAKTRLSEDLNSLFSGQSFIV